MIADDGVENEPIIADNDNSFTCIRFTGSEQFFQNLAAGVKWEVECQSDPSNVANIQDRDADGGGDPDFNEGKERIHCVRFQQAWCAAYGDNAPIQAGYCARS